MHTARKDTPYDLVAGIMDYESDGMGEDRMVEFFQHLVDTGVVWQLQGSYGRTAAALIEAGLVTVPGNDIPSVH